MQEPRRILITGGTSPIGHAIVNRMVEEGNRVVFTGRNHEHGNTLAKKTNTTFLQGDICDPSTIEHIVRSTEKTLSGLDTLILNAGVLHRNTISATSDSDWDTTLETNLISPFLFVKACLPMLKNGGGTIVAIASGTALWPEMELGAYSISKRALQWMAQMLAVEVAPFGITVNVICPGDTDTGMSAITPINDLKNHKPPIIPPLGRLAVPADIAATVAFFISSDSAFCTGASLTVDGGMRASLRASDVNK